MTDVSPGVMAMLIVVGIAILIHFVGMLDAWITYREWRSSAFNNRVYLRVLAVGGIRTAFFRLCQQMILFYIGIQVPPRVEVAWALIAVCSIGILKELLSIRDRHRTHVLWEKYLHSNTMETLRDF